MKSLMSEKKVRQEDLALLIKKTPTTINNYLTGKSKIDIDTFKDIASALNVPISYFFEEDNHQVSKKIIQNGNHNNIGTANSNNKTNTENEILLLQKEIEGLRKEIELLREINDLLKKGKV